MAILTEEDIRLNIKLSSSGNTIAQKKIYEHAYTKCFSYVKKYSSDSSDQITIFNNAMLDLFKHIYKHRDIPVFDGFIINTLKWRGIDFLRARYKECKYVEFTELHNDLQVVEFNKDIINFNEEVQIILAKIPEKERTVFILFELDEMSHLEISQLMQISVSYSKWLLFNAKKTLKNIINKNDHSKTQNIII